MSIEKLLTVGYSRQTVGYSLPTLGQHDRAETYTGKAEVRFTPTKVQLWERGLCVLEMARGDWWEIATEAGESS